ncbi:MAG: dihydroorotate dehydrogenase (quinone), partial [Bacteroidota bacterium]|nr:dihydroorotate dehydrogenase (quinone) [Bacteroidota bacterium]
MYHLLRRILFLLSAETAHYFSMNSLRLLCALSPLQRGLKKLFAPVQTTPFTAFGLSFPNRIGLGAGFDKNAKYLRELETLGFGFV